MAIIENVKESERKVKEIRRKFETTIWIIQVEKKSQQKLKN